MRFLILVGLFMVLFGCSNQENARVVSSLPQEPTCEELRVAMRFHGVLVAQQDENREWYFIRNGKRCPLFTQSKKQETHQPPVAIKNS